MALDLRRFIERFIGEARDHLAGLELGLAALGAHPDDPEAVNALFRSAHTIKGSARMLKLSGISETAHHLEDLLGALRAGRYRPEPTGIGLLLRGVDAIAAQLDQVERSGGDPPADPDLCRALAQAAGIASPGPDSASDPGSDPKSAPPTAPPTAPGPAGPDLETGTAAPGAVGSAPPQPPEPEPSARPACDSAAPSSASPAAGQHPAPGPAERPRTTDSVRVPLARLDPLIGLIGELGRAQTRQRHRLHEAQALARAVRAGRTTGLAEALKALVLGLRDDLQGQERIGAELSERALGLRLLPLATVFDPAARMVRELARTTGKEVRCEVSGAEIEVDRAVISGLGEALVQVLRNAIDHGIEDPEARRATGKPTCGQLRITARHASGGIEVELADDGRGLSRERILARALKRGLLDPARAATLTDEQVWELIYAPGLSTSEIITDLSGRGVGMDVIRRAIAGDLHGTVSLSSHPGTGTRFLFRLPRSLAMMRVLLCECAGLWLGLPAQHVVELRRCAPAETIDLAGRPAVVLRNEFIPLVPLAELLDASPPPAAAGAPGTAAGPGPAAAGPQEGLLTVVIGVRQAKVGLLVERVADLQSMLVKPLPAALRGCRRALAAGLVVTDDDRLVTVLSAGALLERARRLRGDAAAAGAEATGRRRARPWEVLVVDDSQNTREIIKELLEVYGYRVTTAEDGLKGWQKALGGRFDAVLTDLEMPGLDGFGLTARLRANPHYQTTPIVVISSRASEDDRRRGVAAGADAYIVKGDFDQSGLLDTLVNLLGEGGPDD